MINANLLDGLKWFLLGVMIILIAYITIRLLTKAFFTSYFEGKAMFFFKKSIGTVLTRELKNNIKEKQK